MPSCRASYEISRPRYMFWDDPEGEWLSRRSFRHLFLCSGSGYVDKPLNHINSWFRLDSIVGGSFKHVLQNSYWFWFVKALPSYGLVETIILLAKGFIWRRLHRATSANWQVFQGWLYVCIIMWARLSFFSLSHYSQYINNIDMYVYTRGDASNHHWLLTWPRFVLPFLGGKYRLMNYDIYFHY